MRIMSPKRHWTNVGKGSARAGLQLSQALTNNDATVDAWITAGFKSAQRKINLRLREQCVAALDETFDLIAEKAGA